MVCNLMASYFKKNQKVQRKKIQSRSERAGQIISDQEDQSMSGAIIVEHIRYGASRSKQTQLRGMIRLEQSGVKSSGDKCDRSERSENIRDRQKSRAKREKKTVVRISERRARKLVWSRVDQAVQYKTTQSKENIRSEKVDKQRRRSTSNNVR